MARLASPRQQSRKDSLQKDCPQHNSFEVLGNLEGNDDASEEELYRVHLLVMQELQADRVISSRMNPSTVGSCPHSNPHHESNVLEC